MAGDQRDQNLASTIYMVIEMITTNRLKSLLYLHLHSFMLQI